jgi:hypothetical protein
MLVVEVAACRTQQHSSRPTSLRVSGRVRVRQPIAAVRETVPSSDRWQLAETVAQGGAAWSRGALPGLRVRRASKRASLRSGRTGSAAPLPCDNNYLVDPASSHMLVSKIKPCMSKYKHLYCETANGSLNQLWFLRSYSPTWITVAILELIHVDTAPTFGEERFC